MRRWLGASFDYSSEKVVLTQNAAAGTSESERRMELSLNECEAIARFADDARQSLKPVKIARTHLDEVAVEGRVITKGG